MQKCSEATVKEVDNSFIAFSYVQPDKLHVNLLNIIIEGDIANRLLFFKNAIFVYTKKAKKNIAFLQKTLISNTKSFCWIKFKFFFFVTLFISKFKQFQSFNPSIFSFS